MKKINKAYKEGNIMYKAKVNTVGKKDNAIVKLLFDESIPDNMEVDQSKFNTSMTAQIVAGNLEIDDLLFGVLVTYEKLNSLVPTNFPEHNGRTWKEYAITVCKKDPLDDDEDSEYLLIGGHTVPGTNYRQEPTKNAEFKLWVTEFGVPAIIYEDGIRTILDNGIIQQ